MATRKTKSNEDAGLNLSAVGDLSGLLNGQTSATNGKPLLLAIKDIDEDPDQPRKTFDPKALKELADNISRRGVKCAISVRSHPEKPGHYIINFGARRYRASILAGRDTIPAYIDEDYASDDQVVENLQRADLSAREIAVYIGREIAKGREKQDIAAGLSKSPAFVSQHAALLDLPAPLAEAFDNGRCTDVTVINELLRLWKKNSDKTKIIEKWLKDDSQDITRKTVTILKDFLNSKKEVNPVPSEAAVPAVDVTVTNLKEDGDQGDGQAEGDTSFQRSALTEGEVGEVGTVSPQQIPMFPEQTDLDPVTRDIPSVPRQDDKEEAEFDHDPSKFKKAIVCLKHDERPARLVLTRRPAAAGLGWIKYDDDGTEAEIALDLVTITHLVEG